MYGVRGCFNYIFIWKERNWSFREELSLFKVMERNWFFGFYSRFVFAVTIVFCLFLLILLGVRDYIMFFRCFIRASIEIVV